MLDTEKQRVAIYARVSTEEQVKEGYGLEYQEDLLKQYVKAFKDKGWYVDDESIYSEKGLSGALSLKYRPELSRLYEDIKEGKIKVVLVWKIDRLFRNTQGLLEFVNFLEKYKVNFVSKNESVDLSSPTGKFFLTITAAFAEMEKETIRERTSAGKRSKALDGYIVYGSGVPYDFSTYRDAKGKKLQIHEDEAEIVKKIFHMYVEEDKTVGEISKYLTSIGAPLRDMKTKEKVGHFNPNHISRILKNRAYLGFYECNKTRTKQEEGTVNKSIKDESEWIIIQCPKIIDEKIFQKAQEKIERAKTMSRAKGENYFYTGILRCGCGHAFNHYKGSKGTHNYRCGANNKHKIGPNQEKCKVSNISELKLHGIVRPMLKNMLSKGEKFIENYRKDILLGENKKRIDELENEITFINKKIQEKEKLQSNAIRQIILLPEYTDDFRNEIEKLKIETNNLKVDLEEIKIKKENLIATSDGFDSVKKLQDAYRDKISNLTEEQWRVLTHKFIDCIYVSNEEIKVIMRVEKDF